MLTVVDIEEIELNVKEQTARLEAEFQARFHAPLVRAQRIMAVLSDPALAEQIQREDPREYERIVAHIKRMQAMAGEGAR